ncbi:DUF2188 domain-containing protein [Mesotoga prima]|uniref:DUF2188 domain-containing protein n=1 Tax=Mesotoga prima TaxID=1184387 RepID=UPI0009D93A53|nr:DUF2188 domain-containing protein [Thermotogota bacterium]MCP5460635.1 DUF2188 domain-containing protein [Thermotogota bacterium]
MEDISHVKPHEDKWVVDHESEEKMIHVFEEKVDAVKAASEMARNSPIKDCDS